MRLPMPDDHQSWMRPQMLDKASSIVATIIYLHRLWDQVSTTGAPPAFEASATTLTPNPTFTFVAPTMTNAYDKCANL